MTKIGRSGTPGESTEGEERRDDRGEVAAPGDRIDYPASRLRWFLALLSTISLAAGIWFWAERNNVAGSALTYLSVFFVVLLARSPFGTLEGEAERTRDRINREARRAPVNIYGDVSGPLRIEVSSEDVDEATSRASEALRRQEEILLEIYTQGLAQAKLSFRISVFFAGVGASLLLVGVGLAVGRASSDGERYASIVAGLAGAVTNLISGVFFLQSNRARKNMGDQGVLLREESREDRRVNTARELAASIVDLTLRDRVRADLARRLVRRSDSKHESRSPDDHEQADPKSDDTVVD